VSVGEKWTKSSHSDAGGSCVEVRRSQDGDIQVRDSKNPSGPVLTFTPSQWDAFIGATKRDGFNM
jgi:hypothetical protein